MIKINTYTMLDWKNGTLLYTTDTYVKYAILHCSHFGQRYLKELIILKIPLPDLLGKNYLNCTFC